jgi:hypothetical protein
VKAAAVVLAVLVLLSGWHVTVPLAAGYAVAVPLPVLVLAAGLGACAVPGWLIAQTAGWHPWPSPERIA